MIIGYILLAIALAEFALGLYFIFRYVKQQSTIWYGLFCIGVAIYVGSNGMGYINPSFFLGERMSWAGAVMAATFFLPFSLVFPLPRRTISEVLGWVVWPLVLFIPALLVTDTFISNIGITRLGNSYQTSTGPLFWFVISFFVLYWIWSVINLIISFRGSDGIYRKNLKLILIGIFVSVTAAIGFDIILPLITSSKLGYVGSLMTSVWLSITSYIIKKA